MDDDRRRYGRNDRDCERIPAAVVCADDYQELMGINTPDQLAEAEAAWRQLELRGGHA